MLEPTPSKLTAAAMATGPEVEGRLRYALDPKRSRRSLGIVSAGVLALAIVPLTFAIALADESKPAPAKSAGAAEIDTGNPKKTDVKALRPKVQTVVLDPGHGGLDTGSAKGGVREKELTLKLAMALRERLEKAGYRVVMTRFNDSTISIDERARVANKELGALFLSLHFTDFPTKRYELYTSRMQTPTTTRFRESLANSLGQSLPDADIRQKEAPWGLLMQSRIITVMFDASLPKPAEVDAGLESMADALATGISDWSKAPAPASKKGLGVGGLEIEADKVDYVEERKTVVAKGNVKVADPNLKLELSGDEFEYDMTSDVIRMMKAEFTHEGKEDEVPVVGKAGIFELEQKAKLITLSDNFVIEWGRGQIVSKTHEASASLDLDSGKVTVDGVLFTRPFAPKIEEAPGPKPEMHDGAAAPGPVEKIPLADGFDFPVGAPDGEGYYRARGADLEAPGHLGEDWNGVGGGNTDFGDPVKSIGAGKVVLAKDAEKGWGKVVIVRHAYRDQDGKVRQIESLYRPLGEIDVATGDVVRRGQQIGTIGSNRGMYLAHLHLEIRKRLGIGLEVGKFPKDQATYHYPTDFIKAHRPEPRA